MGAIEYTQIFEIPTGIDSQIEANEKLSAESLDTPTLESKGFEHNSGLAEYNWPELNSRKRSRHSYSYYNLTSH